MIGSYRLRFQLSASSGNLDFHANPTKGKNQLDFWVPTGQMQ
jgi:hypothetical protein